MNYVDCNVRALKFSIVIGLELDVPDLVSLKCSLIIAIASLTLHLCLVALAHAADRGRQHEDTDRRASR
jgi:hypothetical protein